MSSAPRGLNIPLTRDGGKAIAVTEGERYVGERRALRHFLQELRPLVIAALGEDSVLGYRIDRALRSGDLHGLRAAREMFHHQPEDLKRRLMRGIFEAPKQGSARSDLFEPREPEPFVRFDASPSADRDELGLSVVLERDGGDDVPLRVLVRPGTLPGSAAAALRGIADWIERDRRLLSARHWRGTSIGRRRLHLGRSDRSQRDGAAGGSADEA